MSKKKPKIQYSQSAALVVIGAGLILIGLVAFISWPRDTPQAQSDQVSRRTLPIEVQYAAPDLTLTDIFGVQHSLAEFRGQVVLVNLWATWCPPCKAEMPTLQAFYEAHAAKGYTTVAINDGDPHEDVLEFVQEYGLSFPVWLDPTYIATDKAFKTRNLPSSFVIDRDGMIRLRWVGEIDRATLEEYVTPLILEP